ncbi:peroxisomal 3-ketoacyl-CoA thiolase 3 [Artemisia annua]|uniref:Peroxisomal 3-ketoacyl-CoA thiolase 3 n=1 Tax=Artemisia annua TaxID=35608 RepID=A0A2U1NK57_ARTAN|nr:peroxisomal 3-ketoacyl-CoA thiolase 3 [Artemisia annua]
MVDQPSTWNGPYHTETVPVRTKNRQCSSALQAVADVAAAIKVGFYDIGISDGLESMTANPMAWDGSVTQGYTPISDLRVDSHRKAAAATSYGKFKDKIIPVKTKGIRPGTTLADLARLKPVFKKGGSTTAGTSIQVSDGAGVVLLMKRSTALQKGLPILGLLLLLVFHPRAAIMCSGPAVAIPAAVKAVVLKVIDIELFEINEAFASPFFYCQKKLEIDPKKINVNGGARAIRHPLGATEGYTHLRG